MTQVTTFYRRGYERNSIVLPSLMRNPADYFAQTARRYGGVVTLSPNRAYLVTDPDGVKHVLQDNHTNYIKGPWYQVLRPLMGDGLFSSDGDYWKRQRRLIQPAFQRKHHPRMVGIVVDSTSRMLQRWEGNASRAGRWMAALRSFCSRSKSSCAACSVGI